MFTKLKKNKVENQPHATEYKFAKLKPARSEELNKMIRSLDQQTKIPSEEKLKYFQNDFDKFIQKIIEYRAEDHSRFKDKREKWLVTEEDRMYLNDKIKTYQKVINHSQLFHEKKYQTSTVRVSKHFRTNTLDSKLQAEKYLIQHTLDSYSLIKKVFSGPAGGAMINPLSRIDASPNLKKYDQTSLVYEMCNLTYADVPAGEITDFIQRYIALASAKDIIQSESDKLETIRDLYKNFINYFEKFTDEQELKSAVDTLKRTSKIVDMDALFLKQKSRMQGEEKLNFSINPLFQEDSIGVSETSSRHLTPRSMQIRPQSPRSLSFLVSQQSLSVSLSSIVEDPDDSDPKYSPG